jgi:hypothetical protein
VVREVIRISSLYKACDELFAAFPLAVRVVNLSGTIRSMVLTLRDGADAGFFVLVHDCGEGTPFYSLSPWHAGSIADIEAEGGAAVPDVAVNVVTRGIPIPRHGSLFGWTRENAVTAMVPVYATYALTSPEPRWAVMPLAGIPEVLWPPFTDERLFGHWFWEHYRAGRIVSLDDLIAETPGTVFWVDTEALLGWHCCAVACSINSPEGPGLRRGRYVYYQALRAGKPVPPLDVLLADTGKIDLTSRFGRTGYSDGWPHDGS